jgi:type III secretion protein T
MEQSLAFARLAQEQLLVVALCMLRPLGALFVLPIFLRAGFSNLLRLTIAISLSLPATQYLADDIVGLRGGYVIAAHGAKELFIGVLLGLVFGLPFWKIQAVGEAIDNQRGVAGLAINEPNVREPAAATAVLLSLVATTAFFIVGGMKILTETFYISYTIFPVNAFLPPLASLNLAPLVGMIGAIFRYMVVVSAPILILLFLVDLSLFFLNRSAQRFNIFDLSMIAKAIVYALVLPLYIVFVIDLTFAELRTLEDVGAVLRGIRP